MSLTRCCWAGSLNTGLFRRWQIPGVVYNCKSESAQSRDLGEKAMQSSIQWIGVVGLGHMGSDFASNLMADGFQIKVYDRNEKHTAPLVARGATASVVLWDLAGCEAVLTSLPADDALADVRLRDEWLVHVLGRGAIHVSMSTVSPGLSRGSRLVPCRATWRLLCLAIPILLKVGTSS